MTDRNAQSNQADETLRFDIGLDYEGQRLDKVLSALTEDLSRARLQALVKQGYVRLNELTCLDSSKKLSAGDRVDVDVPAPESACPEPENIPLDIVYEDEDLLVLDKPAGLVVHPGAGNPSGTLVNALLYHCKDSLSGIGGVLRPGIVHRLDKDTSGLMVVAKNDKAHRGLALQLEDRSLSRTYQALVLGVPMPIKGYIDQPVGRHPVNRQKMAVNLKHGKAAKTYYKVLRSYAEVLALVECKLESGRTHQIRVHISYLGHPIVGDPVYGPQINALRAMLGKAGYNEDIIDVLADFPRQILHACALSFVHPCNDKTLTFVSELPEDIYKILKSI